MQKLCVYCLLHTLVVHFTFCQQEILSGLQENLVIKEQVANTSVQKNTTEEKMLKLPFFDDFSKITIFPDSRLWIDQHAFVNNSYDVNPPTHGVATLDAIDKNGCLFSHASSSPFTADSLTSQPIDLKNNDYIFIDTAKQIPYTFADIFFYNKTTSSYMGVDSLYIKINDSIFYPLEANYYYDTTITLCYRSGTNTFTDINDSLYYRDNNTYNFVSRNNVRRDPMTIGDSIYLSFYYQAQGLGDSPEENDSLCLYFYAPLIKQWQRVWGVTGRSLHDFTQVLIPVTRPEYFGEGFRFRFLNYASLSSNIDYLELRGNVDHWNIDYVRLDKKRNKNDLAQKDVAMVKRLGSMLNSYEAMPYRHYLADLYNQKSNSIHISYRNLFSSGSARRMFFIKDKNYTTVWTNDEGDDPSLTAYSFTDFISQMDYDFNAPIYSGQDHALYYIYAYLRTDNDDKCKQNDTVHYEQRFYNYYAYDDGTAEAAYGFKGEGTPNAMLAYKFPLSMADSLYAIDMYFARSIDSTVDYAAFKLTVWNDNNGVPGSIIYQEEGNDNSPNYKGINKFYRYELDNPLAISGTIYVGFVQKKKVFLSVGFDFSRNTQNNIFYNFGNGWNNTVFSGSLMIRPVMGNKLPLSIEDPDDGQGLKTKEKYAVYPNPATNFLTIKTGEKQEKESLFTLLHHTGSIIYSVSVRNGENIDISHIPAGMYIAMISENDSPVYTQKILIIR